MNPVTMVVAARAAAHHTRPSAQEEPVVQYLCLIYQDEQEWQKLPQSESQNIFEEFASFTESV
ncbi:MAG: hypothetical protein ACREJC_19385, partial [Tepidisphaeraceae bacterium]